MFAVKGIYSGNRMVLLERDAPVNEGDEVIVTIVRPPQENEIDLAARQAAFQRLLKYKGTVHRHIDYKKELAEYRDEKYGHSH